MLLITVLSGIQAWNKLDGINDGKFEDGKEMYV